jgi:hypothetical protein
VYSSVGLTGQAPKTDSMEELLKGLQDKWHAAIEAEAACKTAATAAFKLGPKSPAYNKAAAALLRARAETTAAADMFHSQQARARTIQRGIDKAHVVTSMSKAAKESMKGLDTKAAVEARDDLIAAQKAFQQFDEVDAFVGDSYAAEEKHAAVLGTGTAGEAFAAELAGLEEEMAAAVVESGKGSRHRHRHGHGHKDRASRSSGSTRSSRHTVDSRGTTGSRATTASESLLGTVDADADEAEDVGADADAEELEAPVRGRSRGGGGGVGVGVGGVVAGGAVMATPRPRMAAAAAAAPL